MGTTTLASLVIQLLRNSACSQKSSAVLGSRCVFGYTRSLVPFCGDYTLCILLALRLRLLAAAFGSVRVSLNLI